MTKQENPLDGYARIPHEWIEKGKIPSAVCKRCGLKKANIIKQISTKELSDAVISGQNGSDFEKVSKIVKKKIDENYCLNDDELIVKDIIE